MLKERIWDSFFGKIDDFLLSELETLTCNELYALYAKFSDNLRTHKGNAKGFTGLSEYLMFRYIYFLLGGEFTRINNTNELFAFEHKTHKNIILGQDTRVNLSGNKRMYPDVVLYNEENITACMQIKLFVTNGVPEIESEVKKFNKLFKHHKNMKALIVIYYYYEKTSSLIQTLKVFKKQIDWFDYIILQNNNNTLKSELSPYFNI